MVLSFRVTKIAFIFLLSSLSLVHASDKIIAIIGTGYVGLVSGAGLADFHNRVICADVDANKINGLIGGVMPIYEPGLKEVVDRNVRAGRLTFTSDVAQAIRDADVVFIAVGTPMDDDGSADLSYIDAVVETIAHNMNTYKIIVTKSTVPIGTGKKIRTRLEQEFGIDSRMFSMVSNPEFLREGFAVNDFLRPDRLVVGTDSDNALIAMCEIYEQLIATGTPHVLTDLATSEMIKYASNAFLSVKISFINEIANLCDALGADTKRVAYAMGLDSRISPQFLRPGPGFGGSCFPKDSQAIVYIAGQNNLQLHTVSAAITANNIQKQKPVEKLIKLVKGKENLQGKTVAVLGLAFKPDTDDIRYSPAITAIEMLQNEGAFVKAYDPIAADNMRFVFPDITYCSTAYEAVTDADAVLIITEWDEIKHLDFGRVRELVRQPVLVDARNIINPTILKDLGFVCDNIGQSYLCKKTKRYLRKFVSVHLRKQKAVKKPSNSRIS